MLSFITFKEAPEQVEIIFDAEGAEDLIRYLQHTSRDKDHMHLIEGNEINNFPLNTDSQNKVFSVRHVRIEYQDTSVWTKE